MEPRGTVDREARDAFLDIYQEDLAQGALRTLAEYQALFPGHEDDIADEFSFLEDGEDTQTQRGSSTLDVLPDPTLSQETIGPYRLLRELGRGGQAIVYLAVHRSLGRRVALKILRRNAAIDLGSESEFRRFRREASVASRLDHPAICSVYEAGEADGYAFIAMRYVEGRSLAEKIAGHAAGKAPTTRFDLTNEGDAPLEPIATAGVLPGKAEIAFLVGLMEKVARALHVAHEQGLIHRDVKPANLIITHDGEPVILDFGLAREEESKGYSLTRTGDVMGTPYYMAPEQLAGRQVPLDRRTDVYGLGVTLYEALTLHRPFEAKSRQALYQMILHEEPQDPRLRNRAIPRDLHVVIQKALAKRPEHRYPTALEFAEDLHRVRTFEPVHARPVGPFARIVRWSRKRPGIAALLFVLVLFALGFTWNLLQSHRQLDSLRERLEHQRQLAHLATLDRLVREAEDDLWPMRVAAWKRRSLWESETQTLERLLPRFEAALAAIPDEEPDPLAAAWQTAAWQQLIDGTRELETRRAQVRGRERHLQARLPGSVASWNTWAASTPRVDLIPLEADPATGTFSFLHVPSCSRDETANTIRRDGIVFRGLPSGLADERSPLFVATGEPDEAQRARAATFVGIDPLLATNRPTQEHRMLHRLGVRLATAPEREALADLGLLAPDQVMVWILDTAGSEGMRTSVR
ncbi:MAG: serine/threonine protein kinase [Planctomycetes bacterium]|nr:serine/threonine protein kinase [Planctomycetota bacterium]